jgi:large subunit ribosomal protein L13
MKSFMANPNDIERKWFIIDAEGKTLGRLAVEVAKILRGKHKPIFTPHVDTGDHVIVINADKVTMTGKKLTDKTYFQYSGYPGGGRFTTYGKLLAEKPERMIEISVKGMLPHNTLGRQMFKKLKVYRGAEHPHAAQMPEVLEINIR